MPTPVRFYYPSVAETGVPADAAAFGAWHSGLAASGRMLGPSTWIVQTALELKARGFPCEIVASVPDEGIVVAHRSQIPSPLPLSRDRYWVCVLADKPPPHPYCNFHLLQNPTQFLFTGQPCAYVPHWLQVGLRPRDPARGDAFANIGYFGQEENLAPELATPDLDAWFAAQGLRFVRVARERWHDYAEFDASIAVRLFDARDLHASKPATKLVNGWLAGVPVVAGVESAFRAEGQAGVDYLEATTVDEVKAQVLRLRDDVAFRQALVAAGRRAGSRFTPDAIAARWLDVLQREIPPRFARWQAQFALRAPYMRAAGRIWEGLGWRNDLTGSRIRNRTTDR